MLEASSSILLFFILGGEPFHDGLGEQCNLEFYKMVGTHVLLALQNNVLYSDLMRRPLKVKSHLDIEELELRYRKAKDPVEKSQWQIVWLLSKGKTTREISEITGYGLTWIRAVVHRYNEGGPMAQCPGRSPLLCAPLLSSAVQ